MQQGHVWKSPAFWSGEWGLHAGSQALQPYAHAYVKDYCP